MRKNLKFVKAQSMIEVVIGISVVVILAISLITTTLITQRTATSAKNNSQATKLAQQQVEQIRIFRDRKGFALLPAAGCHTLSASSSEPTAWEFFACVGGAGEIVPGDNFNFDRKIEIQDVSPTQKKIIVTVSWAESSGALAITNTTFINNWCAGQIVAGSPCPSP